MQYVNRITLEGIVTDEPRTVAAGTAEIMKFTLRNVHFKKGGEQEKTYLMVDAWTDSTRFGGDVIRKSSIVEAEGRLRQDKWTDKTGQVRYSYTLVASSLENKGTHQWHPKEEFMTDVETIPF